MNFSELVFIAYNLGAVQFSGELVTAESCSPTNKTLKT